MGLLICKLTYGTNSFVFLSVELNPTWKLDASQNKFGTREKVNSNSFVSSFVICKLTYGTNSFVFLSDLFNPTWILDPPKKKIGTREQMNSNNFVSYFVMEFNKN